MDCRSLATYDLASRMAVIVLRQVALSQPDALNR